MTENLLNLYLLTIKLFYELQTVTVLSAIFEQDSKNHGCRGKAACEQSKLVFVPSISQLAMSKVNKLQQRSGGAVPSKIGDMGRSP